MSLFKKATKASAKLRLGLSGVSGGGKTYTALQIAKGIGGRVALIDTEHASASKYADVADFDTMLLSDHSPKGYVDAIEGAENEGYDVVIIDSLTHGWDKAKEMASENEKRTHNSFNAWNGVTQEYKKIQNKIVSSKIHVIGTYRAKEEFAQEKGDNGKTKIRKLGVGIDAGKAQEFEFDIMLNMEEGGTAIVSKTRYSPWNGKVFTKPNHLLGKELAYWLSDGSQVEDKSIIQDQLALLASKIAAAQTRAELKELGESIKSLGLNDIAKANLRKAFELKASELQS